MGFLAAPAVPPSSDTNPLPGRYRLEIDAGARSGARCELVPTYAHRREYTADIHDLGDRYAVKLFDATFLADGSGISYGCRDSRLPQVGHAVCHQFLLTGDPSALSLTLEPLDEWRGTEIWEGLPDGFVLQIAGRATGAVRDGRIEATGRGWIWTGNGLPASTSYGCQSDALRFTFSRRYERPNGLRRAVAAGYESRLCAGSRGIADERGHAGCARWFGDEVLAMLKPLHRVL